MQHEPVEPWIEELEGKLATLRPTAHGSRERTLFEAGRAAGRTEQTRSATAGPWKLVSLALAVLWVGTLSSPYLTQMFTGRTHADRMPEETAMQPKLSADRPSAVQDTAPAGAGPVGRASQQDNARGSHTDWLTPDEWMFVNGDLRSVLLDASDLPDAVDKNSASAAGADGRSLDKSGETGGGFNWLNGVGNRADGKWDG